AYDLHLSAMLFGERTAGGLQLGRSHVVRWRIDEVPAQRHALDNAAEVFAIDALGDHKAHIARVRLAVARELVGAKRKSQGGEPLIMRRIGESVGSRRQLAGQLSGPEAIAAILTRRFDPKQRASECPVLSRKQHQPASLGLESRGGDESAPPLADVLADRIEISGTHKPDPDRLRFAGACQYTV